MYALDRIVGLRTIAIDVRALLGDVDVAELVIGDLALALFEIQGANLEQRDLPLPVVDQSILLDTLALRCGEVLELARNGAPVEAHTIVCMLHGQPVIHAGEQAGTLAARTIPTQRRPACSWLRSSFLWLKDAEFTTQAQDALPDSSHELHPFDIAWLRPSNEHRRSVRWRGTVLDPGALPILDRLSQQGSTALSTAYARSPTPMAAPSSRPTTPPAHRYSDFDGCRQLAICLP